MTNIKKGSPTYIGEYYVDIVGKVSTIHLSTLLINKNVFFIVEPMPDNIWRIYIKSEFCINFLELASTLKNK
jgi:hypothetical protein